MSSAVADPRSAVLSMFDKAEVSYAEKIPAARAIAKLKRLLEKEPALLDEVELTDDERAVLASLGLGGKEEAPKGKPKKKTKTEEAAAPKSEAKKITPPTGLDPLARKLLAKGKSEKKVLKVLARRYREAGFDDAGAKRRAEIILSLAKEEPVKTKKKAKKSDEVEEKKSKKGSKPAKASKKPKESDEDEGGDDEEEAEEKPKKKAKKEEKPAKKSSKKKAKASDDEEEE